MPLIRYRAKRFGASTQERIDQANAIIKEYVADGYDLTLRQLYYQLVARDLMPNKLSEYKRLSAIISDARLDGQIDWNYISDRTRNLHELPKWESPIEILQACADQFRTDKWADQNTG